MPAAPPQVPKEPGPVGPLTQLGSNYAHLDCVRATAVLLVFFGHLRESLGHPYGVAGFARLGVIIFFVHTCLVLFLSMNRLGAEHLWARFYIRRIARIYPLAILAVVAVLLFHIPSAPSLEYSRPDWSTIAANLALSQNVFEREPMLSPMWSLAPEVQMYAILPVLFILHTRRRVPALALWAAALAFSGSLWLLPWDLPWKVCVYFPCFFSGIVAFSLLGQAKTQRFTSFLLGMIAAISAGVVAPHVGVPMFITNSFAALGIGFVIGRLTAIPPFIAHIATTIAKYSYGIYLAHMPLMWLCLSGTRHRWVLFTALSIVVPVILYHAVEHPFIKLGARATALPKKVDVSSLVGPKVNVN